MSTVCIRRFRRAFSIKSSVFQAKSSPTKNCFSWSLQRGSATTTETRKLLKQQVKTPSTVRIRIFFNPQLFLSGSKNFHVHTYPYSVKSNLPATRIPSYSNTQYSSLRLLATEAAAWLPSKTKNTILEYSIHGKEMGSILFSLLLFFNLIYLFIYLFALHCKN